MEKKRPRAKGSWIACHDPTGDGSERGALLQRIRTFDVWGHVCADPSKHVGALVELLGDAQAALSSPAAQVPAEDAELARRWLRVAAERLTRCLASPDWNPRRSHIEDARNALADAAAKLASRPPASAAAEGVPEGDTARLDFLESATRKSRTGLSFDWIPAVDGERSGFRFMTHHNVRKGATSLRAAIDEAMKAEGAAAPPAPVQAGSERVLLAEAEQGSPDFSIPLDQIIKSIECAKNQISFSNYDCGLLNEAIRRLTAQPQAARDAGPSIAAAVRLLRYADTLDATERPASGEDDITADIRTVVTAATAATNRAEHFSRLLAAQPHPPADRLVLDTLKQRVEAQRAHPDWDRNFRRGWEDRGAMVLGAIDAVAASTPADRVREALEKTRDALETMIEIGTGSGMPVSALHALNDARTALQSPTQGGEGGTDVSEPPYICTKEAPWRQALGTPVRHEGAQEVGGQRSARATVLMRCPHCGAEWNQEPPS